MQNSSQEGLAIIEFFAECIKKPRCKGWNPACGGDGLVVWRQQHRSSLESNPAKTSVRHRNEQSILVFFVATHDSSMSIGHHEPSDRRCWCCWCTIAAAVVLATGASTNRPHKSQARLDHRFRREIKVSVAPKRRGKERNGLLMMIMKRRSRFTP
jgi:hypothetical protein